MIGRVAALLLLGCTPPAGGVDHVDGSSTTGVSSATKPSADAALAETKPSVDAAVAKPSASARSLPKQENGLFVELPGTLDRDGFDEASEKPEGLCEIYLRKARADAAEISKTFSFHQLTPSCTLGPALATFSQGGAFRGARVLSVTHISRKQKILALHLERGWVPTWIRWNIEENESRTPNWTRSAPDRFTIQGTRLIAYVPGLDEHATRAGQPTRLLGAYACEDKGGHLRCAAWDLDEDWAPLGKQTAQSKDGPWGAWQDMRTLDWQDDGSLRIAP